MDPRLTRFLALGLRSNPFANATFDPRDAGTGSPLARRLLVEPGPVLQVIGAKGAGKTHAVEWVLDQLRRQGRRVGYVHLELPGEAFAPPGPGLEVFVLDEADRATPGALASLGSWARSVAGRRLLVTTHEDVRAGLGDAGAPSFPAGAIGRDELEAFVASRLARVAFGAAPSRVVVGEAALGALLAAAGTNWQAMVDLLYRVFEGLGPDGQVTAERVADAARHLEARGV